MTKRTKTHRPSGRVPKGEHFEGFDLSTHDALDAAMFVQMEREPLHAGIKSRRLSALASRLELAFIERRPKDATDRLCLDVAALALRILERGD